MPEKKERKEKPENPVDVRSSSFKEIVNGEVVKEPEIKKPAEPAKKSEAKITGEKKSGAVKRLESGKKFPGQKEKRMPDAHKKANKSGDKSAFKIIEGGVVISEPRMDGEGNQKKPESIEDEKVERSLKNSTMEGVFNSASGSIQSSFTTPLALALGASNAEIGILNSFENLMGTVAQVPGAMLTKYFNRKTIWLVSQILSRILIWIPILFLPFLDVGNRVLILIVFLALSNFFLMIRSPAWSSLMGDLVSIKIRGRYFGRRNMLVGISGVVATLAAGFLLVYWGFAGIFLLSMICAAVAIFFFMRMHEPPVKRVFHYGYGFSFDPKSWWTTLKVNKEFTLFTVYMTFMNFAIDVAAPFYAVYMLKNLSIGYEWFAIAVVVGALARALTMKYWGRLNDRFGSRKILIICGVLGCFVPFGWMLVSNVWHVFMIKIYDGVVFSGFDLVVFNYLLEVTPAGRRPKYIAAHNFFTGFGTVFGDLFGALLAIMFENASIFLLAGLQIVFLASFALRLASCSLLLVIKNIDVKQSDMVPVRYVFWQAIAVEPARGIRHAVTFTFRYPSEVEKDLRDSVKNLKYKLKLRMNR
jgi:MFS family permease